MDIGSVQLTEVEIQVVEMIAHGRHVESRIHKIANKQVDGGDLDAEYNRAIKIDKIGAMAEMAYCKYRNKYFEPRLNNFKEADVGNNVQIRGAELRPNGRPSSLIIRKNDNPHHYYVLVECEVDTGRCWVRGWVLGKEGMKEEYFGNKGKGKPCYWLPQSALVKI
jgi:hypothetical protein